ncbi:CRISPR-associated protein Cas4 [Senimuribacter intestinalis]|uniref:CRISPR-associated protein Cas4 n=1 Tax=Senimuribacter intestinalis TaxID=2941507 RepID=UPI00203C8966|nr:CRISPR-associated protein Cas4 [Senimuribacter intestinalis]
MAMYTEEEYIQLSGIQHFAFCRRQWALIHVEQQWAENYQTTAGILMHKKAHDESSVEKRGDLIIMRGLRIASRRLGLSGQCDVVEFHRGCGGITLSNYDGTWDVVPVEYKRGTEKDGCEDAVQLCAQAICLEEMFLTDIPKGYLFYGENKRRTEVIFDMTLRGQVEKLCEEMHTLYRKGNTPKVKTSKKCRSCSLKDLCLPKLNKKLNVERYIADRLGEGGAL